jgi:hypothetical protein
MRIHSIQTISGGTDEVYHGEKKKITAQFASRTGKPPNTKIKDI